MIAVLSQVSNCLLMEVGHKSSDVIEIIQNTPEQSLSPGKVLVPIKAARESSRFENCFCTPKTSVSKCRNFSLVIIIIHVFSLVTLFPLGQNV